MVSYPFRADEAESKGEDSAFGGDGHDDVYGSSGNELIGGGEVTTHDLGINL